MHDSELFLTQDGSHSLHSSRFGVSYHSKYGAIQETQVVFLEAGLHPRMQELDSLRVLEIGMGSGLNTFMTLLAAERHEKLIDYVTYEAFPILPATARRLNYPGALGAEYYTPAFLAIHHNSWGATHELTPHFTFRKEKQRFESIDEPKSFDVIYFDAFAPNAQPELWEAAIFARMYEALSPGGVLTTYCAKGVVKRTLRAVGFEVEALPGPPGKREMTRAWRRA